MTTRINGQSIYGHVSPSMGAAKANPLVVGRNLQQELLDEKMFARLDEYLSSEPGTERAVQAALSLRK
jgi:hypothetical protein